MARHQVTPRTPRSHRTDWWMVALGVAFLVAGWVIVTARHTGWVVVAVGVFVISGYLLCARERS